MPIHVLDSETIDKIAAGEVVERPSSVVKELVENAIDAGATAITVEAKEGGIEFIRVTDNGSGMEGDQLRTAFLRHATSKIARAEDLNHVASLGFRGEALSSIAAVAKVEVITKTAGALTGSRIFMEGAAETGFEEVGAPDGTTFLVRNLFFNTPVRRRFLKPPVTEGGYIAELMEHLALSRPDISFKFLLGGQTRFHTSGNGDLREVIYRIYGRDIANCLVPIQQQREGIRLEGYLGKPVLVRSNRNFEVYYINGRFIKSSLVAHAIEEGYREYLMQHKFPFCVLHITMEAESVDVNVHPTKMDVRFRDGRRVDGILSDLVHETLRRHEMIPNAVLEEDGEGARGQRKERKEAWKEQVPEPFEQNRAGAYRVMEQTDYRADRKDAAKMQDFMQNPVWQRVKSPADAPKMTENLLKSEQKDGEEEFFEELPEEIPKEIQKEIPKEFSFETASAMSEAEEGKASPAEKLPEPTQMDLFEEKILSQDNRSRYHIIGQVFDTYWLVQFQDKLFIIDQHAAHEKVKYERLMKQFHEKKVLSQALMPPVVVSLSGQEEAVFTEHQDTFAALGFEIEAFGGSEYTLRGVPVDLYGCSEREMFLAVLDELAEGGGRGSFKVVEEKIASMSCKAAVKGNNALSLPEAEKLIDELLTLENPYNCPHGRPTIISMDKNELEKKFKRIV